MNLQDVVKQTTPGKIRVSEVFGFGVSLATEDESLYLGNMDSADVPVPVNKMNAARLAHSYNMLPELVEALDSVLLVVEHHDSCDVFRGDLPCSCKWGIVSRILARAKEVEI